MSSGYVFRANAYWTVKRRGEVQTDPGVDAIPFAAPPEFQGESGFWSPEHFLLAAVGSCFVATFRAIAEMSKFDVTAFEILVEGVVDKGEGGLQFTELHLKPLLTICLENDRERAGRLLDKAEKGCLISRSLKCSVAMEPDIQVRAPQTAELTEVHPVGL